MIHNNTSYTRRDKLRDVISDNSQLLTVLARFDISLGFGDSTVEDVCRDNNVDADTFLAVVNFISGKEWQEYNVSLPPLIEYLRRSHLRFIDYSLPNIKKTLIEGINESHTSEIAIVILQFLDQYIDEVKTHMGYEDSTIFSYAEDLLSGKLTGEFTTADFSSSHENMAAKLVSLKELFIYRYKQKNNERINAALLQLILCGEEMSQHCDIENQMLFPRLQALEAEVRRQMATAEGDNQAALPLSAPEELTVREKEVMRWMAQGLSTKEIADRMCISAHTVSTYRKTIAAKLNIHSATGIAFYAVLHGIIDIGEIDLP